MIFQSLTKYISTFNFCLPFIGFQIVTSLFLPNSGAADLDVATIEVTRNVTIPYRGFALFVSLFTLLLNYKNKIPKNTGLVCFFVFWFLLVLRIFYDLHFRIDLTVNSSTQRTLWMYVFFICLIPTLSVAKSINKIDFRLAFKIIIGGYILLIPVFYFNNPLLFSDGEVGRLDGNLAMGTIAFGHYGVTLSLLSIFLFVKSPLKIVKTCSLVLFFIGVFVMFRAASRGPFIALIICVIMFFVARKRTITNGFIVLIVSVVVLYFTWDILLGWISDISPTMVKRITEKDTIHVTSGRDFIYERALHYIIQNPISGYAFAVIDNNTYYYSHNMILDALLGLGIFGGILFIIMLLKAFSYSFHVLKMRSKEGWIFLICIQSIIAGQFSNAFYLSDLLNVLLATVFVLYYDMNRRKMKTMNK